MMDSALVTVLSSVTYGYSERVMEGQLHSTFLRVVSVRDGYVLLSTHYQRYTTAYSARVVYVV